jgi:LPXTG-site transpeptidase (sortase) family protein
MKKGLAFYVVTVFTVFSIGLCAFTIKQSIVGATYHENSTYYEGEPEVATSTETIALTATSTSAVSTSTPVVAATSTPFISAITSPKPTPALTTNPKYPDRLIISSISVNAFVQQTGLTKTGAMGIPTNFYDVAWYRMGAIPGEKGNAVIDGHVDNAIALPGVFKNLTQVKVGDDIYVVNKKGEKAHFVVASVTTYNYQAVPLADIFGETEKSRLHLITCGGTWMAEHKTYDNRTIVVADLASSTPQ